MFTTPTVVGDLLFVGSCSGVAYAFDRDSGAVRWSYDTRRDGGPAQFHGDPAILGDLLVTGSDSAEPSLLYAFHWQSGALRWKTDSDVIETDASFAAGALVGATWSGDLVGLDPASGERRWKVAAEDRRCGKRPHSPAVAGELVYFSSGEGILHAVDPGQGEVVWRRELGCASTAPLVWGEDLYLGVAPDKLVRVRLADGRVIAEHTLEGRAHSRLTVAGDSLLVLVGGQALVAFDRTLSEERWRRTTETDWSSFRPLVWKDLVVVGDAAGQLFALDPRDGSTRWSAQVRGTIRGLGAEGEVLYVGTLGGTVYALVPEGAKS